MDAGERSRNRGARQGLPRTRCHRKSGLDYLLESHVMLEVLEAFGGRESTPAERRSLLLYYAEHDAYPYRVNEH